MGRKRRNVKGQSEGGYALNVPEEVNDTPSGGEPSERVYSAYSTHAIPARMRKYWHQRYRLFSRWDEGVMCDEEGFFSVTPETIAAHIAKRYLEALTQAKEGRISLRSSEHGKSSSSTKQAVKSSVSSIQPMTILDPFCGAGGNVIQFALAGMHVIAIDISESRLACAKHNAAIYGVQERITFIHGNFFDLVDSFRPGYEAHGSTSTPFPSVDALFLSPPWGGPEYLCAPTFNPACIDELLGNPIMETCQQITSSIGYFLPRNTDLDCLPMITSSATPGNVSGRVEVEEQYLNNKCKSIMLYYGPLIHDDRTVSDPVN